MKNKYRFAIAGAVMLLGLLAVIIAGCASAPTGLERKLFNVETNYVPKVVVVTNIVTLTNSVGVPVYQTNIVTTTNQEPKYSLTKGPGETQITETGRGIGDIFGVGGLVVGGLGILFGFWRWVRSSKTVETATTLVQEIAAIREFIKQLPDGARYDAAFVKWMMSHQNEAGVISQVSDLLAKEIGSSDATVAAAQLRAVIDALTSSTTPPAPVKV